MREYWSLGRSRATGEGEIVGTMPLLKISLKYSNPKWSSTSGSIPFYKPEEKSSSLLKSGTIEKENTHIWDTKLPSNMEKSVIQNALNYLSTFLLQVQTRTS